VSEALSITHSACVIEDICIGIRYAYCAVRSNGTALGLCFVPLEDISHSTLPEPPSIDNVLSLASSASMLDRIISVAYINALSQYTLWVRKEAECMISKEGITGFLVRTLRKTDRVAVIGNMVPLVEALRGYVDNIYVFERNPTMRSAGVLPDSLEYEFLEKCNIVIVSGAALVNGTISPILRFSKSADIRVIVGPTAQMHPDVLLRYFDVVASVVVKDIPEAMRRIRLGGGRRSLSGISVDYVARPS